MDELIYNYFVDLRRKDIDKFKRAKLIRDYMAIKGLSIRAFALEFGLNKSTVEDWLLIENLSEKEYESLQKQGFTETDIYRELRNNRKDPSSINRTKLNRDLNVCITILKKHTNQPKGTAESCELVKDVIKVCNTLLLRLERKNQ